MKVDEFLGDGLRQIDPHLPVIVTAEKGSVDAAARAIDAGATDFLVLGENLRQDVVNQRHAPKERVHVVPNGVEEIFLNSAPAVRGPWLVCTATITERKRVLELAEAAVVARTPLWIIGKPYSDSDPYAQKFCALTRQQPQILRYEGAISDRARLARIYREARGFVLLSSMESLSLSALEAAACECPLLLSDLPWAHSTFGGHAVYCPVAGPERTAGFLRKFYDDAPSLPPAPKPAAWSEVARQLKAIYEGVLNAAGLRRAGVPTAGGDSKASATQAG